MPKTEVKAKARAEEHNEHNHAHACTHTAPQCEESQTHTAPKSGESCTHTAPQCGESCTHTAPQCGESHAHTAPQCEESHAHTAPQSGESHAHTAPQCGESCAHTTLQCEESHAHTAPSGDEKCGHGIIVDECSACAIAQKRGGGHSHEQSGCGCGCSSGEERERPIWFLIAALLVFVVGIAAERLGGGLLPSRAAALLEYALFGAAALLAGWPVIKSGLKNLFKLELEETVLMSVAVIAAFAIGQPEEGALVTLLFSLGSILEQKAVGKSRRSIEALVNLRPKTANLVGSAGEITEVEAQTVAVGSAIIVRPGETVPLDAVVTEGASAVNNCALTGESLPQSVQAGDKILSSAINGAGLLKATTTAGFNDSSAARIIDMVKNSTTRKGSIENYITRFSRRYTPAVMVMAVIIALVPPIFAGNWQAWIYRSLVFLVASCPCAIVISIPLTFMAAIGAASKSGMLVKGSKYIETVAKMTAIAFDKTGTITTGELRVAEVTPFGAMPKEELLALAGAAESLSNHPAAQAIVRSAGKTKLAGVSEGRETPGQGVECVIGGRKILCGGARLMSANGIAVPQGGQSQVYLAANGELLGAITVADTVRGDAGETIASLRALGVERIAVLSGDSAENAEQAAKAAGVAECFGSLTPEDKVERIEAMMRGQKGRTGFVGDGINDAPVLAAADVGIAMGLGTDAAIEAADVVLVSGNLSALPKGIETSRRAVAIASFNIAFSLGIKALVLLLGALGLAQMWMAVFADVGVTLIVVLNAMRALGAKRKGGADA